MLKIKLAYIDQMLTRFQTWLMEGITLLIPEGIAKLGYRNKYLIRSVGDDEGQLIEQVSWFGQKRYIDSNINTSDELNHLFSLRADDVFVTEMTLPEISQRDLRDAIRLRLKKISPLPVDQIYFDYELCSHDVEGRLKVRIAIAKKSIVQNLEDSAPTPRSIGHLFEKRKFFTFDAAELKAKPFLGGMVSMVFLVLSVLFLMAGMNSYLEKKFQAAETHQAALVLKIKKTQKQVSRQALIEQVLENELTRVSSIDAFNIIHKEIGRLPEATIIEDLLINDRVLQIKGYIAFEDLKGFQTIAPKARITQTQRPNYSYFVLNLPLKEVAHDTEA